MAFPFGFWSGTAYASPFPSRNGRRDPGASRFVPGARSGSPGPLARAVFAFPTGRSLVGRDGSQTRRHSRASGHERGPCNRGECSRPGSSASPTLGACPLCRAGPAGHHPSLRTGGGPATPPFTSSASRWFRFRSGSLGGADPPLSRSLPVPIPHPVSASKVPRHHPRRERASVAHTAAAQPAAECEARRGRARHACYRAVALPYGLLWNERAVEARSLSPDRGTSTDYPARGLWGEPARALPDRPLPRAWAHGPWEERGSPTGPKAGRATPWHGNGADRPRRACPR